jgi:two-component system response regulator HydG
MARSVLVVEDEPAQRSLLSSMLRRASLDPELVDGADAALGAMSRKRFGAILSDIKMPGRSGIELVREARRVSPETPVVVMTGFPTLESAVESIRAGAFDYIQKPFRRDELIQVLNRALDWGAPPLRGKKADARPVRTLLGSSAAIRRVNDMIDRVARGSSTVMLRGESGTGKEVVSRCIHAQSDRRDGPFLAVNCAAIPEGLLESELFGHTRGAFTGAVDPKKGLFEQANGGTVLLDEIGDMPLGLQAKLLRVLEEREVRPVGGVETRPIDVRIIAATHRDLESEVEEGRFRRDLFYRLNVVPLFLPPLRAHMDDIPELSQHVLSRLAPDRGLKLSSGALERLGSMPWRGNVRELENVLERAAVLSDGSEIGVEDLDPLESEWVVATAQDDPLIRGLAERRMTLEEVELRLVEETLALTGGNMARTAEILGVSRRTLQRRRVSGDEDNEEGSPEEG